jgi:uncharacterized Zn-finger protein
MTKPKLKAKGNEEEIVKNEVMAEETVNEDEERKEISYSSTIQVDDDGISEELPLLAGYIDENGTTHSTFRIREMDGRDEEAMGDANSNRDNPSKTLGQLVERCTVSIGTIQKKEVELNVWRNIIKSLLVGDIDFIALKIKELSLGKEIEATHVCPYCGESLRTFVDVNEFETVPFKGDREVKFMLPKGYRDSKGLHKSGRMRLANQLDREILTPIARKNLGKGNTLLLTRLCEFDDEGIKVTEEVMKSLVVRDREYLAKLSKENNFGIDPSTTVECPHCQKEFRGAMSVSNFI